MKFGLYLKNEGVITAEQLVAALEFQQHRMPQVGQLAIEEGILSARQVFQILRCQTDLPHERFGEVAVSMSLMTPAELKRLLLIQWERKPPLDEVFVALRMMSRSQAESHLAAYRTAMERRNVVIKRFIPTGPHASPEADAEAEDLILSDSEAVAMMY